METTTVYPFEVGDYIKREYEHHIYYIYKITRKYFFIYNVQLREIECLKFLDGGERIIHTTFQIQKGDFSDIQPPYNKIHCRYINGYTKLDDNQNMIETSHLGNTIYTDSDISDCESETYEEFHRRRNQ